MTSSREPAGVAGKGPPHPLDPLTAGEIQQVAAILRRERGVGASWRFAAIELKEPANRMALLELEDTTPDGAPDGQRTD